MRAKSSKPLIATTYDLVQAAPLRPETLRQLRREMEKELALAGANRTEESMESTALSDFDGEEDVDEDKDCVHYKDKTSLNEQLQSDEVQHRSTSKRKKQVELLSSVMDLQPNASQLVRKEYCV